MSMFYALIALCLFGNTLGQVITSGDCPDLEVEQNFNISKILGRWYEQARFYTLFEANSRCNKYDYIAGADNTFKVISTSRSAITGQERIYDSEILTPDREQSGKLVIKIPMSPTESNNLWVLGIDYNAWIVVSSCNAECSMNLQYAWILTREKNPDESIMREANEVIKKNNIDPALLMKSDLLGCHGPV